MNVLVSRVNKLVLQIMQSPVNVYSVTQDQHSDSSHPTALLLFKYAKII